MKITAMRKDGIKLTEKQMTKVVDTLYAKLTAAGFVTEVSALNGTSIKVGMHMCSFRIDTNQLGYNARVNDLTVKRCKAGFQRTSTPTWNQREDFNHIINNVLDRENITASIRSGDYVVRTKDGRVNFWDYPETFHNGYRLQVSNVLEVVPMEFAKDAVQWVGVNAPFIGAVPNRETSKYLPKNEIPF